MTEPQQSALRLFTFHTYVEVYVSNECVLVSTQHTLSGSEPPRLADVTSRCTYIYTHTHTSASFYHSVHATLHHCCCSILTILFCVILQLPLPVIYTHRTYSNSCVCVSVYTYRYIIYMCIYNIYTCIYTLLFFKRYAIIEYSYKALCGCVHICRLDLHKCCRFDLDETFCIIWTVSSGLPPTRAREGTRFMRLQKS